MGNTLQQKIDQLAPGHKAEARADELILEELSLRALRKGLKRTQVEVAETLGIGQDTVSRLESRCNIMLSTLDRYIKAIGGEVSIVADFPDRPPVKLTFDEMSKDLKVERKKLRTSPQRQKRQIQTMAAGLTEKPAGKPGAFQ